MSEEQAAPAEVVEETSSESEMESPEESTEEESTQEEPQEKAPTKVEAKKEPASTIKTFKIKINGKEKEVKLDMSKDADIQRYLELAEGSREK